MLRSPNNLLSFHVLSTLRREDLITRSRELHAISIYISLSVWHHEPRLHESLADYCLRYRVTTKLNYSMQTMSNYNNNHSGRDNRRSDDRRDERRDRDDRGDDRRDNRKDDRRDTSRAPPSSHKRTRSRSTSPPRASSIKDRGGRSRSPSASPTTRDLLLGGLVATQCC